MAGLNQRAPDKRAISNRNIEIPPLGLGGTLALPIHARGLVVFAHGSGSSRFSPRNVFVATALNEAGFATLVFDLLTPSEDNDRANVFDIPLLADRPLDAIRWIDRDPKLLSLLLGLFGATGAVAALVAAVRLGDRVGAVTKWASASRCPALPFQTAVRRRALVR